jgi:hypothetical protein
MGKGERPEHTAPPEIFYNEDEARKYTTNSRMINIQVCVCGGGGAEDGSGFASAAGATGQEGGDSNSNHKPHWCRCSTNVALCTKHTDWHFSKP